MLATLSQNRVILLRRIIRQPCRAHFSTSRFRLGDAILQGAVVGFTACGAMIGTGYAFYHFSGARDMVNTLKPALDFMSASREQLANDAPSQALEFLRYAAKAYVAHIPGAGYLVDASFNAIDGVVDEHGPEATAIITRTYDNMLNIIQKGGNEHKASDDWQIISVVRRLPMELSALGAKTGQHYAVKYELEQRVDTVKTAVGHVAEDIKSKIPMVTESVVSLKDKALNLFSGGGNATHDSASQPETDEETSPTSDVKTQ